MKKIVVYSHGFGVRKDDRGLFTDIAASLPEIEHIMFDYNLVNENENTLTVSPLPEQAKKLKNQLDKIDREAIVDVVAHSQGCAVAALAKPQNVRKVICLAPPDNIDAEQLVSFFGSRDGSVVDLEAQSRIPRQDGSTTLIPASYWQSLRGLDVIRSYNRLSGLAQVKLIIADEDEVLGVAKFDGIDEGIEMVQLPGNHDFTDTARQRLLEVIRNELIEK